MAARARFVGGMMAVCSPDFFERERGFGMDSQRLIFVVGPTRSGTTRIEQSSQAIHRFSAPIFHPGGVKNPAPPCIECVAGNSISQSRRKESHRRRIFSRPTAHCMVRTKKSPSPRRRNAPCFR
jgi:hypothetical protein